MKIFCCLQDWRKEKMQVFRKIRRKSGRKALDLLRHPMKLLGWMGAVIGVAFVLIMLLTILCGWQESGYTAFGSFFTALAFAGMIATVLLQRAELQEQRKELRAQRKELEIQNRTAQLQRFENSFFHLLEGFKQTVVALRKEEVRKKSYYTPHSVSQAFEAYNSSFSEKNLKLTREQYIKKFANIFNTMPSIVKRFSLEYYCIIDFIINHDVFKDNNITMFKYVTILNIELTNNEYKMLLYYAITNNKISIPNKYKLFTSYSLDNSSYLPFEPWHILFFEPSAFGPDYEEYIKIHKLEGKTLADYLPEEQPEEQPA